MGHILLRTAAGILRRTPALIIDDEGDQAGLNTQVNQGAESTTYSRLLALKATLPHHSYLQYTATPQESSGTATFATPLILSVDKGKYTSVAFIENGKKAGTAKVGG